ncbi:hypothetical protein SDRG_03289 [Saprolegnia diclina VS20]|uniref:BTB domain-containing protein n=1 Tax=Saprolegnia diclina (strain VS20) TaxID=1156394 RepID=T0QWN3_SAPDV|nr:hypothetical protein SDRG_03289 [Saprolegnia diclina VS20]EQC39081.1 hypothetical protein SDRG_03289 [Saprolegnia diclina VS20]|eukprot:XP_008607142.1 hypothetical protein SDRG_03289 [Saprolegnia diclina VS20]
MDGIKDKYRREWETLEKEEAALAQEKKKLSDEWVSIEKQQQLYEKDRTAFEKQVASKLDFLAPDTIVHFNVGGKLFKSTVSVWARDRFSILAQLCTTQPKLCADGRGHYFFDRDWLVFKFIYAFLRDKTLPESMDTLRDLYYEASFYRITLLRHAIEAYLKSCSSIAQVHAGYATDPSLAIVRENEWSTHGRHDGTQSDRWHHWIFCATSTDVIPRTTDEVTTVTIDATMLATPQLTPMTPILAVTM